MIINSKPEHGLGDKVQPLTFRMAANAIFNKMNIGSSVLNSLTGKGKEQLRQLIYEARALANSIVQHDDSGDDSPVALNDRPAGISYTQRKRWERQKRRKKS